MELSDSDTVSLSISEYEYSAIMEVYYEILFINEILFFVGVVFE